MSAQLSAPHSTAANAMTKTSTKSCRALSARGSGTSWKRFLNFCIGRPPHSDSGVVFRIHIARQRNTATMAKCDSPAALGVVATETRRTTDNIVRVGLNYKWGAGGYGY